MLEVNSLCKNKFLIFLDKFPVFSLSGKMNIQIPGFPCFPCAVATLSTCSPVLARFGGGGGDWGTACPWKGEMGGGRWRGYPLSRLGGTSVLSGGTPCSGWEEYPGTPPLSRTLDRSLDRTSDRMRLTDRHLYKQNFSRRTSYAGSNNYL